MFKKTISELNKVDSNITGEQFLRIIKTMCDELQNGTGKFVCDLPVRREEQFVDRMYWLAENLVIGICDQEKNKNLIAFDAEGDELQGLLEKVRELSRELKDIMSGEKSPERLEQRRNELDAELQRTRENVGNIEGDISKLELQKQNLEDRIADKQRLEQLIRDYNIAYPGIDRRYQELKSDEEQLRRKNDDLKNAISLFEKNNPGLQSENERLEIKSENLKAVHGILNETKEKLKNQESMENAEILDLLQNQMDLLNDRMAELDQKISGAASRKADLIAKVQEKEVAKKNLEKECSELDSKIEQLSPDVRTLTSEISSKQKLLDRNREEVLPNLQQNLIELDKEVEQQKTEITEVENNYKKKLRNLDTLRTTLKEKEKELQKLFDEEDNLNQTHNQNMENLNSQISSLKEMNLSSERYISALKKDLLTAKNSRDQLDSKLNSEEIKKKVSQLEMIRQKVAFLSELKVNLDKEMDSLTTIMSKSDIGIAETEFTSADTLKTMNDAINNTIRVYQQAIQKLDD